MSPVMIASSPLRADVHADVARACGPACGSSHTSSVIRVVRLDELVQPRLDDRVDRIDQVIEVVVAAGVPQVLPVVVFLPAEQIARLRERRHPLAVRPCACSSRRDRSAGACTAPCRPCPAGSPAVGEILEERRLHVAEHGILALPVVADAGVDHHDLVARPAARSTGTRSASCRRGSRNAATATGTSARTRPCRPAAASRCRLPSC